MNDLQIVQLAQYRLQQANETLKEAKFLQVSITGEGASIGHIMQCFMQS